MTSITELKQSVNITELLDKNQLFGIAEDVVKGYEIDEDSRSEWKDVVDKAMAIAKQTHEVKNFPWPNASNVKYPLITQASIDYASRTLPEIIQNGKVVKAVVVGKDEPPTPQQQPPQQQLSPQQPQELNSSESMQPPAPPQASYNSDQIDYKCKRAQRVSDFMSYQLIGQSPDWEDGLDKLLQVLPVLGTVFKKTYYNQIEKRIVSELCVPDKIVVNYNTTSLETARRITHVITMYTNDIIERQRAGLFNNDVDVDTLTPDPYSSQDCDYPIELLEQHCWMDLDDDNYKEPYIVTVHAPTQQILRIVNRFEKIEKKNDKIIRITPTQFFTDFHFIRSPDGGFYSQGFGSLLLPINKSINTLINQLLDAGTLSNTQGGFVGRGLRLRSGEFSFKMGEWKVLDASAGTALKDNIYPLPVREPSDVLFSLLSLLMQVGKDLAATTDLMKGNQPTQNVASNTISQLVEQGTKVFVAINKRLYRSLKKEYQKIYILNFKFTSNDDYKNVLDDPLADLKKDFNSENLDIYPVADPTVSSENQRFVRATYIQNLRTVDPREADKLLLETLHLDQYQIEKLLPPPDPNAPPPPEVQKLMMEVEKMKAEVAQAGADQQLKSQQLQLEAMQATKAAQEADARINEGMARVWKMQMDAATADKRVNIGQAKMQQQESYKASALSHTIDKDKADLLVRINEQADNTMTEMVKADKGTHNKNETNKS